MRREQDRAYAVLRERLIEGQYGPGAPLREEPLARELGLSRTPIRAALKRLVEDGLATADAGQGVHVAEWSERDIEETFHLRILLEPYAARLAADRGGGELLPHLRRSNEQMASAIAGEATDAIERIQEANRSFHHALIEHSGSPRLRAFLETMIDMPIVVRSFHLATPAELEQSLRHHEDLTSAAEAGDGELAHQVMQMHLRTSYLRFMRHRRARATSGLALHQQK